MEYYVLYGKELHKHSIKHFLLCSMEETTAQYKCGMTVLLFCFYFG